jgi:hypothetical protein
MTWVVYCDFNTCTESLNLLESQQVLGKNGTRTFFEIECCDAKVIRNHSFSQIEGEVLLLPATQLIVVGKVSSVPGTYIVQLRELENSSVQLMDAEFLKDNEIQYANNYEEKSSVSSTVENQILLEKLRFSECKALSKEVKKVVQDLKANRQFSESCLCIDSFGNLSIEEAETIGKTPKVNSSVESLPFISSEIYRIKVCDVFLTD